MDLFTKEEIEKYGFIYEPDVAKCKTAKTGPHYKCNYYKDGVFTDTTVPVLTDEWKAGTAELIKTRMPRFTHLHTVFVPDVSPMSGEGVMCQFVMVRGHGNELTDKWFKTGLLEGLDWEKCGEAAIYLNRVAQELVSKAVGLVEKSPEYSRWDSICGIALPVARMMIDKYPNRPDPKFLVEDVARFWDENQELYKDLGSYISQDQDRQMQELYMLHFAPTWK